MVAAQVILISILKGVALYMEGIFMGKGNHKRCEKSSSVQTIQGTAKRWKAMVLAGWILMSAGVVLFLVSVSDIIGGEEVDFAGAFSVLLMLLSVVFWVVGKAGRYWYHE